MNDECDNKKGDYEGGACTGEIASEEVPASGRHGMDLTKGPIFRTLIVFSLPIVLQFSIQPLFGFMDSIFIARIDPKAFAAVTNAGLLQMLVIMLAAGLANGVNSYISRLVGAGDLEEADNAANHAIMLMLVFSLGALALGLPFDREFFRALNVEEELMPRAHQYVKIILIGNVTIMFTLVGANILRGEGNSVVPLIIASLSLALNLVLDPLLIFGADDEVFGLSIGYFGMDVSGAALATVISRGLGCALLIGYLLRGKSVWTFSFKNFKFNPTHFVEILRVGFPMLLVNFTAWTKNIVFFRLLNKEPDAMVAMGMGMRLDMVAVLPMIGLMLGVLSMVGQNYGAGDIGRARRSAWAGVSIVAGFSALVYVLLLIFPSEFVSLFNKTGDPHIQELGENYIFIVGPTYLFVGAAFVLNGAFQGLGKGFPPLVITGTRFLLVAIPLALILYPLMGANGAWIAVASAHIVGGVFAFIWVMIEFRRRERMAQESGLTSGTSPE